MSAMVSQNTGVSIVYSTVCSNADQRKHQSSVSLAFVRGIHWWPVNFPHKGPVTRKMFPFDDVIIYFRNHCHISQGPMYQLVIFQSNRQCSWVFHRCSFTAHDDVIKWKHFACYWPFVRGIHRSPANSPHKGHWREALMFSLIFARTNSSAKVLIYWKHQNLQRYSG